MRFAMLLFAVFFVLAAPASSQVIPPNGERWPVPPAPPSTGFDVDWWTDDDGLRRLPRTIESMGHPLSGTISPLEVGCFRIAHTMLMGVGVCDERGGDPGAVRGCA